ncbi:MAG: ferrous iron transport protein A [Endomicrobium sp.]|jgi:Fe2+ transport system protein FeoA|nr:ferrous iron transport protein A [Endomicrobium sp.]
MKQIKRILRYIYGYLHRYLVKAHFHKHIHKHIHKGMKGKSCDYANFHKRVHGFKPFNNDVVDNFTKLSCVNPGEYKLLVIYCNRKLKYRLLEMGFVPGKDLIVINNGGPSGGVMIKIKGAKIALSNEVADKILVREINN